MLRAQPIDIDAYGNLMGINPTWPSLGNANIEFF
jgi:hypothetical protein